MSLRVTQGYVAYYSAKKNKWKSAWAHLSRQGLLFYPHQYGGEPFAKAELTSQSRVQPLHVHGLANVVEIVHVDNEQHRSVRLALQSRVDQKRWQAAVQALASYFDAALRGVTSMDKSDNELEDDFIERLEKGSGYSSRSDSEGEEVEFATIQRGPLLRNSGGHSEEELFVIKKSKKRRGAKSGHSSGSGSEADSDRGELQQGGKKKRKTLRDVITHDSMSHIPVSRIAQRHRGSDEPEEEESGPKDSEEEEEDVPINPKLAQAKENKVLRKKRVTGNTDRSTESGSEDDDRARVGFGAVEQIPNRFKPSPMRRHDKPFQPKSILKKSTYAEEPRRTKTTTRKKSVSLNLTEEGISEPASVENHRPRLPAAVQWQLRDTQFASQVRDGVETVKNPLYNPVMVKLRNDLDALKAKSTKSSSEPATIDLSGRELTAFPDILCRHSYLSVIHLYMNQIRTLPLEIGKLTRLVQLGLNENSLFQLPRSIGQLASLEILDLRYNRLQELPKEIGDLKALKRLFLRYNRLVSLPDTLGNLTQLELLSVRNNSLYELPETINNLSKLKVLDIHQNQIGRLPPLGNMTVLVDLDAQNNQLSRLPKDMEKLQCLRKLRLGHNKLKEFPPEICELSGLEELDLEGNMLVTLSEDLSNLNKLKQLYLSRNKLTSLPDSIGSLVRLRQLFLSGNRLSQLPQSIGKLRELKDLDLGTNNFSVFPSPLCFRYITTLNIHDNTITELPANIHEMASVKTLNLGENQLRALPDSFCTIGTLTNLRLNCNELTQLPPNIDQLMSLRNLQLDNNLFEELPPQLGYLLNLTSLSLLDNDLNDLPDELINLRRLKQLKVDGNPLECFPPGISGGAAVFQYIGQRVKEKDFGL